MVFLRRNLDHGMYIYGFKDLLYMSNRCMCIYIYISGTLSTIACYTCTNYSISLSAIATEISVLHVHYYSTTSLLALSLDPLSQLISAALLGIRLLQ